MPGASRRMRPTTPPSYRIHSLEGADRERAVPVLSEGFEGIYRWHAKRTLRTVTTVRAFSVGDHLAGVALLERVAPEAGYVYYIAVGTEDRGRGVGGTLLDDALSRFRAEGTEVVYGAVEEGNLASRRLFESRGFRVVERKEVNYRDGGLGAEGLRSRMWVVRGEDLYGLRIAPHSALPPLGPRRTSGPLAGDPR